MKTILTIVLVIIIGVLGYVVFFKPEPAVAPAPAGLTMPVPVPGAEGVDEMVVGPAE